MPLPSESFHEMLLGAETFGAGFGLAAKVLTVGLQVPCLRGVGKHDLKNALFQLLAQNRVGNRGHDFHAPIQIAAHPVRAADVNLLVAAVVEIENAAML